MMKTLGMAALVVIPLSVAVPTSVHLPTAHASGSCDLLLNGPGSQVVDPAVKQKLYQDCMATAIDSPVCSAQNQDTAHGDWSKCNACRYALSQYGSPATAWACGATAAGAIKPAGADKPPCYVGSVATGQPGCKGRMTDDAGDISPE